MCEAEWCYRFGQLMRGSLLLFAELSVAQTEKGSWISFTSAIGASVLGSCPSAGRGAAIDFPLGKWVFVRIGASCDFYVFSCFSKANISLSKHKAKS